MVRVVVVGAGVNGVGSAVALQRLHPECQITILAKDFTPDTTGDGAAGLWEPYLTGETPADKVIEWSRGTWQQFGEWYRNGESKTRGVNLLHGTSLDSLPIAPPFWRHIPLWYSSLTPDQLAEYGPRYKSGSRYLTFTAEPSKFLPTLLQEVTARGGRLEVRRVSSLEKAAAEADLVINCSGLGARDLVPDPSVYPCRGQVMRVRAPWVTHFMIDDSDESFGYILPNQETVVLGGTHQDNNWNLEVDPEDSRAIWTNCTALLPSLKSAEVVREWVGLRPCRTKGVRLEADELKLGNRTVPVIHNYGHGGCGVTLFWGCSQEVARLASQIILRRHGPTSRL